MTRDQIKHLQLRLDNLKYQLRSTLQNAEKIPVPNNVKEAKKLILSFDRQQTARNKRAYAKADKLMRDGREKILFGDEKIALAYIKKLEAMLK